MRYISTADVCEVSRSSSRVQVHQRNGSPTCGSQQEGHESAGRSSFYWQNIRSLRDAEVISGADRGYYDASESLLKQR